MKNVFAIFIILNLLTISFELNAQPNIEGAHHQEVKNLTAFAKSYGYIRFFYPNKQTEDFNWDAFLVYGIQKVRYLETDNELKSALSDLFSAIAPYAIFSDTKNTALEVTSIFQGDSITFWQHSSFSVGENRYAKLDGDYTMPGTTSQMIFVSIIIRKPMLNIY